MVQRDPPFISRHVLMHCRIYHLSLNSVLAEVAPHTQYMNLQPQVPGSLLPGQVAMQRLLLPWTTQQSATSLLMQQLPMGMCVHAIMVVFKVQSSYYILCC